MKHPAIWLAAVIGLVSTVLAPVTKADPIYRRTQVTFNQPVEIPGMVLMPGTYVMKLLDPLMDRHIVRFDNVKGNHMYAMVFTVPDYRLVPTDHTVITFEERAQDAPQAIKEWFPAGERWGEQFVYSKATPIAAVAATEQPQAQPTASAPALAVPQQEPIATAAPAPTVKPKEQPPVEIAQVQPAPAATSPAAPAPAAAAQPKELPKTASDVPMVALLGAISVLAGAILRRRIA